MSYTLIVLTLFPRTFQFTSRTMCLTWEEAYVVEAWYMPECLYWHWENNDQNVFMGWYSMVYLSYTVCVFCFPRSWWGWLAGVFMKSLCDINMKIQSCWLINLVFFFVVGLYFPLKCIWLCFHCNAMFGAPSFLLGQNQPRGVLLEKKDLGWNTIENLFPVI